MRKSRFTESQIIGILKEVESGRTGQEVCREEKIRPSLSEAPSAVRDCFLFSRAGGRRRRAAVRHRSGSSFTRISSGKDPTELVRSAERGPGLLPVFASRRPPTACGGSPSVGVVIHANFIRNTAVRVGTFFALAKAHDTTTYHRTWNDLGALATHHPALLPPQPRPSSRARAVLLVLPRPGG